MTSATTRGLDWKLPPIKKPLSTGGNLLLCPYEKEEDCPEEDEHVPDVRELDGTAHHYGCDCSDCSDFYRSLK